MHLVQILLPIHDNSQELFPVGEYRRVRKELTESSADLPSTLALLLRVYGS